MKKIKKFFYTIILKIKLGFQDAENDVYKDIKALATTAEADFAKRVRQEYIMIAKLSQKAQADYEYAEALLKEGAAKGVAIIDDLQAKVAETEDVVKSYSKKMFAHLGMFEAYAIEKVKQEEISILKIV